MSLACRFDASSLQDRCVLGVVRHRFAPSSRVEEAHRCAPSPSEPCVRLSPHTAQASHSLRRSSVLRRPEDALSQVANDPLGLPPVDGIPVSSFLGSVCESRGLHLTYPSIGNHHRVLRVAHQTHVSQSFDRASGPIRRVMDSRCLSAWRRSLLGSSCPAEGFRPSCVGPTGQAGPQRGFHVPHQGGATGVGVSYTPGSRCPCLAYNGCHTVNPLHRRGSHRLRRPELTEPRWRLTCVHPSGLPLARSVRMARTRLGHYPLLCSGSLPSRPLGWGQELGTNSDPGFIPWITPLMRPRVATMQLGCGFLEVAWAFVTGCRQARCRLPAGSMQVAGDVVVVWLLIPGTRAAPPRGC